MADEENERRISEIIESIAVLSLELEERRTRRDNQLAAQNRPVRIGDRVRITNNYRGLFGTEGRVVKLTTTWVWLTTNNGRRIKRAHRNVELVPTVNNDQ